MSTEPFYTPGACVHCDDFSEEIADVCRKQEALQHELNQSKKRENRLTFKAHLAVAAIQALAAVINNDATIIARLQQRLDQKDG